jgi:hypothetical protein
VACASTLPRRGTSTLLTPHGCWVCSEISKNEEGVAEGLRAVSPAFTQLDCYLPFGAKYPLPPYSLSSSFCCAPLAPYGAKSVHRLVVCQCNGCLTGFLSVQWNSVAIAVRGPSKSTE